MQGGKTSRSKVQIFVGDQAKTKIQHNEVKPQVNKVTF